VLPSLSGRMSSDPVDGFQTEATPGARQVSLLGVR